MVKILGVIIIVTSWFLAYWLGTTKSQIKYVTTEKEVIRYEKKCATDLLARPSLGNDDITRLLDAGKL